MLQGPVRDTVWALSLADLKTPVSFLKLVRVAKLGFVGMGQELRPQRHINHLSDCRDGRNGHRLKLSLQTVF